MNPSAMKNSPETNTTIKKNENFAKLSDLPPSLLEKIPELKEQLENNTTETKKQLADFKLQFENEVLSNPDFSDGDIPEEIQNKLENETKIADLEKQLSQLKVDLEYLDINNPEDMGLIADFKRSKENIQYQINMIKAQNKSGNIYPEKI